MTINVIDAAGSTQSINTLPNPGIATAAGGLPVVEVTDSTSGSISVANSNYATPTIITPTTNSAVEIVTSGYNNLVIQVSGSFTATLQIQGTADGTNWITLGTSRLHTYAGTSTSSITAAGIYMADVAGLYKARVTSTTTAVTGSASIYLAVTSNTGLPAVLGAVATVSSVTSVSLANLGLPGLANDVLTTSTLTSNTTTASSVITPSYGCSYEVSIPVTAFSGTGLSLDVIIQESDDTGATTGGWFDVYHFERITGVGTYRSPKLPLTGNRIRYVQVVTGTITTLTRAINRLQSSDTSTPIRRFFDRSFNSTQSINAVTSAYTTVSSVAYPFTMANPSKCIQLIVSAGNITGTSPTFKLQGSEDNSNWYDIPGAVVTAVTGSTLQQTVTDIRANFLRTYVQVGGSNASLNYICIKAFD